MDQCVNNSGRGELCAFFMYINIPMGFRLNLKQNYDVYS